MDILIPKEIPMSFRRAALAVLLSVLAAFSAAAAPSPDAVSAASTQNYYGDSSPRGTELYDLMSSRRAAFVWSTVNGDGSPNASVMVPGVVDRSEGILSQSFGGGGNQTITNMRERGLAVLTVYQHNPDAEDRLERNIGARLVVEYISDRATQNRLIDRYQSANERATLENTVFLRIVRVLPLG
jgi:hypothetical protein